MFSPVGSGWPTSAASLCIDRSEIGQRDEAAAQPHPDASQPHPRQKESKTLNDSTPTSPTSDAQRNGPPGFIPILGRVAQTTEPDPRTCDCGSVDQRTGDDIGEHDDTCPYHLAALALYGPLPAMPATLDADAAATPTTYSPTEVLESCVRYAETWRAEGREVFGPAMILDLVRMVRERDEQIAAYAEVFRPSIARTSNERVERYLGTGGTARAMADAARHDALKALIETADLAAGAADRRGMAMGHELREAAARARMAFGLS